MITHETVFEADIPPSIVFHLLADVGRFGSGFLKHHAQSPSLEEWGRTEDMRLLPLPEDISGLPVLFDVLISYQVSSGPQREEARREHRVLFLPGRAVQIVSRSIEGSKGAFDAHQARIVTAAELHSAIRTSEALRRIIRFEAEKLLFRIQRHCIGEIALPDQRKDRPKAHPPREQ